MTTFIELSYTRTFRPNPLYCDKDAKASHGLAIAEYQKIVSFIILNISVVNFTNTIKLFLLNDKHFIFKHLQLKLSNIFF